MLERTHLACLATLPDGHPFEAVAAAAAGAGFNEFAAWLLSLDRAREELGSLAAVKSVLDDQGLELAVLELLHAWAVDEPGAIEEELAVVQHFADVFDPEVVLAATLMPQLQDNAAAALKSHCQALAPRKVALEFLPFTGVPNLAAALALRDAVGEPNLGLVIDSWHFARAGFEYELLEQVPGEWIHFIQLNDAAREPWADPIAETMGGRLRPGEGAVDWPRFIGILEAKQLSCPIGTEQYSDLVKAMPLEAACRYLYDSVQAIVADPHHQPQSK